MPPVFSPSAIPCRAGLRDPEAGAAEAVLTVGAAAISPILRLRRERLPGQITKDIEARGRSGVFANRDRLPSERDLAEPLAQNGDIALFPRTDDTLHHRIASIAQDPLTHVVPELPEDQRRMSRSPPEALSRAMAAHRQMVESIRDRDADRAEAAMRAHLTVVVQTYSDIREEAADPAD
ncbi:FCD domain-containing protein [Salipiger marinus]|uniref:FCD domain-containing protein n=1 Tax=Salipiger marinus TaxID=555512 RepID=A0A1G8KRQ3_9RHOB|nr:FCD domain-containing protein [Salipiger marinus]SDI46039.1 FCD domain-containing protein [Salipiger marinus]